MTFCYAVSQKSPNCLAYYPIHLFGEISRRCEISLKIKYTVLIKMNISKESINWLLMPKKDDQLLSINQLR